MILLPDDVRASLPPLYSQEKETDPMIHVKYFTPDSSWTWYVTEGETREDGHEPELGYFVLSELESVTGPMGLHIERDLYFEPKRKSEVTELAQVSPDHTHFISSNQLLSGDAFDPL